MTLSELYLDLGMPNSAFEGIVTNDDNILAMNISVPYDPDLPVDEYAVVQEAIEGLDSQMNAESQDKTYIRAGKSTTKTNTQRSFKVTGDRFIGDPFQDFVFSHKIRYGVGEQVNRDYLWINALNGIGEKGIGAIIVNSDGSGNAGETAAIDIDIKKVRKMPDPFTYTPTIIPPDPEGLALTDSAKTDTSKAV